VLTALGLSTNPAERLDELGRDLDAAYRQVADGLPANAAVRIAAGRIELSGRQQDNNGDTFLISQTDPAELLDHAADDEVTPKPDRSMATAQRPRSTPGCQRPVGSPPHVCADSRRQGDGVMIEEQPGDQVAA
jgi:hypothetical protein